MRMFWLSIAISVFQSYGRAPGFLFYDLGDDAGADGAAAFADRKAQPFVHRDRRNEFDLHRDVVDRHYHLGALRQMHRAGDIGRAEVELRPVVAEKRRVPPALLLG